eukprot:TRINITY_DN1169_c0_g2_i1.p2 TRINITY_DN1169_c0_g2~~TRINITY_DN1169_c0_g2_i1.p2  ORF type:complete len:292 (+),score=60.30 TRINITY_DN1169_c0_g2_i1:108-983(+)
MRVSPLLAAAVLVALHGAAAARAELATVYENTKLYSSVKLGLLVDSGTQQFQLAATAHPHRSAEVRVVRQTAFAGDAEEMRVCRGLADSASDCDDSSFELSVDVSGGIDGSIFFFTVAVTGVDTDFWVVFCFDEPCAYTCASDCLGHGACNETSTTCICDSNNRLPFTGEDCSKIDLRSIGLAGIWLASIASIIGCCVLLCICVCCCACCCASSRRRRGYSPSVVVVASERTALVHQHHPYETIITPEGVTHPPPPYQANERVFPPTAPPPEYLNDLVDTVPSVVVEYKHN